MGDPYFSYTFFVNIFTSIVKVRLVFDKTHMTYKTNYKTQIVRLIETNDAV